MWGGAGQGHSEVMENCLYCYLSIKLCTLSGGGGQEGVGEQLQDSADNRATGFIN